MNTSSPKSADPGNRDQTTPTTELQKGAAKDDSCRCRETSTMTPRELLRLMMSDLAFWKKPNKE